MRRVLGCVLGLALALVLTACNSDDEEGAAPPRATVATATSTTTPADPYAIPATIDAAYVQRVLDKLYEIDGDATRVIVREGELVPEAANRLVAIYAPDELDRQLRLWDDVLRSGALGTFRDPPGNRRVTVDNLITTSDKCVFFSGADDFGEVVTTPPSPSVNYFGLSRKLGARDPSGLNPTPWMIAFDRAPDPSTNTPPSDPCAA